MGDKSPAESLLAPIDTFARRHIGPRPDEINEMLQIVGCKSLDDLVDQTIPPAIRLKAPLQIGPPCGEFELLAELHAIAEKNHVFRSMIGMGYHDCITPPVIQRNILENPGWYTQYTPYQAEISQGRLEALLNFQTLVANLTALPLANASLLDEATAAAEAMHMCAALYEEGAQRHAFFVADDCHPQTIAVIKTRARPLRIAVHVGDPLKADFNQIRPFGILLQYPSTDGRIVSYRSVVEAAHAAGAKVVVATDLLALTLIEPPGDWGADIAIGNTQRFGVPLGFGGPHAAFMACRDAFKRQLPGRVIGVSKDAHGNPAYRLAIQTREQHIRREKATSNICTAQVLLAVMAAMYAVYHGPDGLRAIARRTHRLTMALRQGLITLGHEVGIAAVFDTLRVKPANNSSAEVLALALKRQINLRQYPDGSIGIALDETTDVKTVRDVLAVWGGIGREDIDSLAHNVSEDSLAPFARKSDFLTHPVFNSYHAEHEMLRYIRRLESRDLSLTTSMIPLGSCTMKLNAASEMLPVSWPRFARLHPFAPADQVRGYAELFSDLERMLIEITGLPAVSLQPNAGSQGEYAGLLVIRAYYEHRGEKHRDVCLIPTSAHGTNPASAVMAGLRVVTVACDDRGNINVEDLRARAKEHEKSLAAFMVTYPSTHGVFEAGIKQMCEIVHQHGGQVYMDGANMNAQVGLCRPAEIGADVCHLNLHKTFCIPHGGGGPGMGPIAAAAHLAPFLPGHPIAKPDSAGEHAIGPVSAAPYGSPSILTISWMYIALMGSDGLKRATQVAILNANYMAARLASHYDVLYTGQRGRVAHEFIIDCRSFEKSAGVKVEDIAKRLMDYGFHAPTMSFPVAGTLMIEPTESESMSELDRFCDALITIRREIADIESGKMDRADNPLKHAPHTAKAVTTEEWSHHYSRQVAAYPAPWLIEHKFWPAVGRIDNAFGDRNLICTCPPVSDYSL